MVRSIVEVFSSRHEAADAGATAIADALRDAVLERGRATFVATGGHTPADLYDRLARMSAPWERVTVTLTDERWVHPDSPESNGFLVMSRLLTGHAAAARFVPLKSTDQTPEAALTAVDAALASIFPPQVTLLGMGEDGHVASLFPGGPAEGEGWAVAVPAGPAPQPRLSLTGRGLLADRLIVLLIWGQAKRRVLESGAGLPVHEVLGRATAPVRVLYAA